jgi:hypothetical protein
MFHSHLKKIPFVLLLLLPSFALTVQIQVAAVLLSKTIVAQHFKLLTGLLHSCNIKFLSSGQHAYRNRRDEVVAITVKLFD